MMKRYHIFCKSSGSHKKILYKSQDILLVNHIDRAYPTKMLF